MILINALVVILLIIGAFFLTAGTIGLLRLPDVYTRLHATTKCDTVGACSILLGIALYEGISFASAEIILILLFFLLASPTAAHAISRASYKHGLNIWEGTGVDSYREVVAFYRKPIDELYEELKRESK